MTEHISSKTKRSRHLSREGFELLLTRLGPDRTRAAERYQAIHDRLSRLYEWRACSNPEELADETMDRVASKLEDGVEIQKPENYILRVASLVFREIIRREKRQRLALEAEGRVTLDVTNGEKEESDQVHCFRLCLGKLEAEDRRCLLEYYEGQQGSQIVHRRRLAKELGLAAGTLRIRMHRQRRRLEACIRACMENPGSVTELGAKTPISRVDEGAGAVHE